MTTQTNAIPGGLSARLEIASRVLAGLLAKHEGYKVDHFAASALGYADALLAADAESRKEEPSDAQEKLEHTELALQQARDERDTLRDQLARVTKERDEARNALDDMVRERTEVCAQREKYRQAWVSASDECDALRAQLAAALAPLPEEEGLEELDSRDLAHLHEMVRTYEPEVCWHRYARHALASHARVKARKAREEGRLA